MRKGQKEEEWVWAISVRGHPSDKWETRNLNLSHIQDFWAADTDAVNNELEGVQEEAVVVCFSQYPTITLVRLRKITKNNESGQTVARSKFEPRTQGIQWQNADHLATFGQTVQDFTAGLMRMQTTLPCSVLNELDERAPAERYLMHGRDV